jgi:hypothetical protein
MKWAVAAAHVWAMAGNEMVYGFDARQMTDGQLK